MKLGTSSYLLDVKLKQFKSLLESSPSEGDSYQGTKSEKNDDFWLKAKKQIMSKEINNKQALSKVLFKLFAPVVAETYLTNAKKNNTRVKVKALLGGIMTQDIGELMSQDNNHNIPNIIDIIDMFKSDSSISKNLLSIGKVGTMNKVSSKEALVHLNILLEIGKEFLGIKKEETLYESDTLFAYDDNLDMFDDNEVDSQLDIKPIDIKPITATNVVIPNDKPKDLVVEEEPAISVNKESVTPIKEPSTNLWLEEDSIPKVKEEQSQIIYPKAPIRKAVSNLEKYINDVSTQKTIPYGFGVIMFSLSLSKVLSDIYSKDTEKVSSLKALDDFFKDVKVKRTYIGEIAFKIKWLARFNNLGLFNIDNGIFNVNTDTIIPMIEKSYSLFENSRALWDGHKKVIKKTSKRKIMASAKGKI